MAEFNTPEDHLRAAIASALNQTFPDFELILVDDCGSNDLPAIVADMADDRIRLVANPANLGLVRSLMRAIEISRGSLLVRMDTDDVYYPHHIRTLVDLAEKSPEFAVYATRACMFSDNGFRAEIGSAGEKGAREIMRGDTPIHPASMLRRESVLSVGGYPDFHRAEDLALWCELLLAGYRIVVGDQVTMKYRVHLADYGKRRLRNRHGELRARLYYYPKLGARPIDYSKLVRSVVSGLLPPKLIRYMRHARMNHTAIR